MAEFEAEDQAAIKKNLQDIFDRRSAIYYAVALEYAAMMLEWFQRMQASNTFWDNQTFDAASGVNVFAVETKDSIGIRMIHTMIYGIYLELANDQKHSAFVPTFKEFSWRFIRAITRLGADNAE